MKKFFYGLLTGIFAASIPAVFAITQVTLKDVEKGSWYESAVNNLTQIGVLQGYPDGTFKPAQTASRAEIAVMFDRFKTYSDKTYQKAATVHSAAPTPKPTPAPSPTPTTTPASGWLNYNTPNNNNLRGIQYPSNFYVRETNESGPMLWIQSTPGTVLLPGEKNCAYANCTSVPGGLLVGISQASTKAPMEEKYLEKTAYGNIKKIKDLANITPVRSRQNLKEAYYYYGPKNTYRIEVYENNFGTNKTNILNGILSSLNLQ